MTGTYTVGSRYDLAGNRTQITYPDNSVVTRGYDPRNQLATIGYNVSGGAVAPVASFSYDNGGRRLTRTLGDTPGTVTTWSYAGRLDNLVTSITTPNVTSFAYTYDANQNKLTETIGGAMSNYGFGTTTPAGYDPEDRLTGWNQDSGSLAQSWILSLAGDWNSFNQTGTTAFSQTRTYNSPGATAHELSGIVSGGLTSPLSYDPKGNLAFNSSNSQSYIWDSDNRLRSAVTTSVTAAYTYDALGRRVSKLVASGTRHDYGVCPRCHQELAEYSASGGTLVLAKKYVYGDYIDEPVMMVNVSARK